MPAATTTKDFVMSRVFDAPRALLWQCFTDPERMKQWWGPKGFTVLSSKMDLRVGGTYHYGAAMWGLFKYREIVPQQKLVFVNSFSDEKGGLTRHPLQKEWPLELLSTFSFEDVGSERTKVTIVWEPINASEAERHAFDINRESMTQGWTGTFDRLAHYLADSKSHAAPA